MTALASTLSSYRSGHESAWDVWLRAAAGTLSLVLLALFLARAPLAWCLATVLGAVMGILVFLRPAVALYLLAFSVPFGALWSLPLAGLALGPSELLLAILLGAWLVRMAAYRQFRVRWSGLAWALLAYLLTILVSFLPARSLASALKELAKWMATLLVVVYVSSNAGRPEPVITTDATDHPLARTLNPTTLMGALLLAGTLQGLLGIYQFLYRVGPPGFILFGHYMRASGTFGQPNPYGGYMGLLLPVAYVLVLTHARGAIDAARHGNKGPMLLWLLALFSLFVMFAALIMSWSRGALLGLVGGLTLVILALGWRVWLPASLALLLLLRAGSGPLPILPSGFVGRALEVTDYLGTRDLAAVEINDDNFAVIERLAHWRAAWLMFERWPWLGVGAGQYAAEYSSVALPRWQDPLGHAHNYILHVMAEGGLLGLAGYLLFSLTSFVVLWRAARLPVHSENDLDTTPVMAAAATPRSTASRWPYPGSRMVGLAALGMWGHLMAHNLFDNLNVHGIYLLVAMMLGLAVSVLPRHRPTPASRTVGSTLFPSTRHHDLSCKQIFNTGGQ